MCIIVDDVLCKTIQVRPKSSLKDKGNKMAGATLPSSLSLWRWVSLRDSHKLAQSSTSVHSKESGSAHMYSHITLHCPPTPASPSCPLSPTPVWGYSPWKRGDLWEDLLSCSLEWTDSGADSVLLGAATSCKERWMSASEDWLATGWWCVSSDWWVNTVPPLHRGSTILSGGSYM